MKSYEIHVNPVSFDEFANLYDEEVFVEVETNLENTECYSVIDRDDTHEHVMDELQFRLTRKFGNGAKVLGYEDASWMFGEE